MFVFFGLVATVARPTSRPSESRRSRRCLGPRPGSLAVALLVVNNLRDIPTDTVAGKRTLAVRMGDRAPAALHRARRRGFVLVVGGAVGVATVGAARPGGDPAALPPVGKCSAGRPARR